MKQDILDYLNKQIDEEHGKPVTMNSKFIDAELDSLGLAAAPGRATCRRTGARANSCAAS